MAGKYTALYDILIVKAGSMYYIKTHTLKHDIHLFISNLQYLPGQNRHIFVWLLSILIFGQKHVFMYCIVQYICWLEVWKHTDNHLQPVPTSLYA